MLGTHHERLKGMIELVVVYYQLALSFLHPSRVPFVGFLIFSITRRSIQHGGLRELLNLFGVILYIFQVLSDADFELSKSFLAAQSLKSVQFECPNNLSV
jgi:hypothetical protein